jgi:hypothetical protein
VNNGNLKNMTEIKKQLLDLKNNRQSKSGAVNTSKYIDIISSSVLSTLNMIDTPKSSESKTVKEQMAKYPYAA